MSKVRTRFAPSPTGQMHVGNLRTALYAYLLAKHEGGEFILRIEDTDQERFVPGAEDVIVQTLALTGLTPDEGPNEGGPCGPYVQSERQKEGIYLKYAKELIEKGEAYYCFCSKERLQGLRRQAGGKEVVSYDKHCLHLTKEQVQKNLAAGMPYVIRQNNPTDGTTEFSDEIYGEISVDNAELDDMILIKSDGYPTYNFANVVDDHLMGITHVVRGNEYLSSTPKYNRLYEAFGWEVPTYVHCPLITDENHQKLSKRSGHASVQDLLQAGFLPETIVNFVVLLGWTPQGDQEILNLSQLTEMFDYHRIGKSPAVFDYTKLRWMNGQYLAAMDPSAFDALSIPVIRSIVHRDVDAEKISRMVQSRIELCSDIAPMIGFFDTLPDYDVLLYEHKKTKSTKESSLLVLREVLPLLAAQDDYSNDALYALLLSYAAEKGYKSGFVMWPIRIALSGRQTTPCGATEMLVVLGKEESCSRIKIGIFALEAALS